MAEGELTRGVLADGQARALRVDVAAVAAHGAELHGLRGHARAWYVEGVACAALLSAYLDDGERLSMQVQASKPRFAFTADVSSDGGVRARLSPQDVRSSLHIRGVMLVLKSVVGREVYRGATEVDHRSFAAMLESHLVRSSQTDARIRVRGGVGTLVERLPGEHEIDLDALVEDAMEGVEGETTPLRWQCSCSEERVLGMLGSLGESEIRSMIEEDGGAVVTCHYCTRSVVVSEASLRELL